MMKAFLTTLLLASSTLVASADTPYEHPRSSSDDVRTEHDDRVRLGQQFDRRADWRKRPIALASNVVLSNRDRRATWVPINQRVSVSKLQIQLDRGKTYIGDITVVFTDGSRDSYRVRQALSWRDRWVTIDLPQRANLQGIFIDTGSVRSARGAGTRPLQRATVKIVGLR